MNVDVSPKVLHYLQRPIQQFINIWIICSDRRSPTLKQLAEQYMEKNPLKEINFATIVTKAPLTKDESFVTTGYNAIIRSMLQNYL